MLFFYFRSLYTEDDISNCLLEFSNILTSVRNTVVAEEAEKISINTHLDDNFTKEVEIKHEILNYSGISNDMRDSQNLSTQDKLHRVAYEIVNEAIRKAVIIVKRKSLLQNWDICDTGHTEERNSVLDPNNSLEESNSSNMSNGHEDLTYAETCKLKSTKDNSEESVTALLERVYGMKTVVTPCSRLGEDLLRLWLSQANCDAYIQIGDKTFQVHKYGFFCNIDYFSLFVINV